MFEASQEPGSAELNALEAMTPEAKSSFDSMIKALKELNKPLRDARVCEFYHIQRSNGQSLDDLANKIVNKVDELYGDMPEKFKAELARDKFYASLNEELVVALVNSSSLGTIEEMKAMAKSIEINFLKMKQAP
ncbi:hypothetical protein BLA29_012887, partial [Euroglyphus maynei]